MGGSIFCDCEEDLLFLYYQLLSSGCLAFTHTDMSLRLFTRDTLAFYSSTPRGFQILYVTLGIRGVFS